MMTKFLAVVVLLGLPCAPLLGAEDDLPRMPSGKPDLSGTYDIKTRTPIARSAKYGNDPYMSAEGAKEIEEALAEWRRFWLSDSDPNRVAPVKGGKNEFQNVGGGWKVFIDSGETAFRIDGKYRNLDPHRASGRSHAVFDRTGEEASAPFRLQRLQWALGSRQCLVARGGRYRPRR